MNLLDPRFRYVPAAATDVGATFRRFGFNARANAERRARAKRLVADVTAKKNSETAEIHPLLRMKA
jgi:hypothetical protein